MWLYTGMTSVVSDESNVGFVLVNMRTKETRYYAVPGAEEYSAMESAQGMVQDLGYSATFPILLNVSDRPTYFVSLKDSAGLVKMYAYIDVQQYQVVGTGTTLQAAREAYAQKLKDETDIEIDPSGENVTQTVATLSGEVTHVASAVVEGNTYYYLKLKDHPQVFSVKVTVSEQLPFVKAGDKVELTVPHPLPEGSVPVSVFSLMQ